MKIGITCDSTYVHYASPHAPSDPSVPHEAGS